MSVVTDRLPGRFCEGSRQIGRGEGTSQKKKELQSIQFIG